MCRERTKLIKLYYGNICSVSLRTQYCISQIAMYFFAVAAWFSDKRTWVSPAALLLQRLPRLSVEQSVVSPVTSQQSPVTSQQSVDGSPSSPIVKSFIQSVSQLNPPRAFSKLHAPSWFFIHCSFGSFLPFPFVPFIVLCCCCSCCKCAFHIFHAQLTAQTCDRDTRTLPAAPPTQCRLAHVSNFIRKIHFALFPLFFATIWYFIHFFTVVLPFGFCPHTLQVKCLVRRIC